MILTVCPNPSIDCTIELDNLSVGMLNRVSNKVETYSGKALNVAIGVARLKGESFATGFMFEDHKRTFEHVLDREGVRYDFVSSPGATRVNYKIIDKKAMLTEINDRGGEVSRERTDALVQKIEKFSKKASVAAICGSLPKGVCPEFYARAAEAVKDGVKLIIDAEKENTLDALSTGKVYMVKPNLKELENFSGESLKDKRDMARAAKKYFEYGVKYVLVSLGSEGAVLTDGKENFFCKSANVAVNSTVGAGDSMVAAASLAIEQDKGMEELLLTSVAAGTAAVVTSGTNLFYKDKYDEVYSKIFVEKFV